MFKMALDLTPSDRELCSQSTISRLENLHDARALLRMGRAKVSDEFTVPVCRLHHRELHRKGDEAAWWSGLNIDPVPIAFALWRSTHNDGAFRSPADSGAQSSERGGRESVP